jgi:Zn-dependent hydrolases, including glyoxylases
LTFAKAHPDYPLTVKQALEQETDAKKRQEKEYELGELLAMDAALPILVPTLATLTFHDSITLHGSKRSAVLRSLGNGHSPCDSALFLPDDDILFAGDLLFTGAHPSIMTGNVPEWISILDALLQDCPALIVPGHGPVADKQAVLVLQEYLKQLLTTAGEISAISTEPDAIKVPDIPADYADWAVPALYERSVLHLVQQAQQLQQTR